MRGTLIIIISLVALSPLPATTSQWDFQYVSEIIDENPASSLWFSSDSEGMTDIVRDSFSSDDSEYTVYLHSETYGASGMTLTATPFRKGNQSIGVDLSCSGADQFTVHIDDDYMYSSPQWADEEYVMTKRVWEMSIVPDKTDISKAGAGEWLMQMQVEVVGA